MKTTKSTSPFQIDEVFSTDPRMSFSSFWITSIKGKNLPTLPNFQLSFKTIKSINLSSPNRKSFQALQAFESYKSKKKNQRIEFLCINKFIVRDRTRFLSLNRFLFTFSLSLISDTKFVSTICLHRKQNHNWQVIFFSFFWKMKKFHWT